MSTGTVTATDYVTLERGRSRHAFTGWNKNGKAIVHASSVHAMYRHKCAFFRRNSSDYGHGPVFRIISRDKTETIPPALICYVESV